MQMDELYQELIIDHGTSPRNCCKLEETTHTAEGYNPLCGDRVHLFLKVLNNVIMEASFQGNGCAISTASSSLMTELLIGKSVEESLKWVETFQTLLINPEAERTAESRAFEKNLGKLTALLGVRAFPARVKCATLAWHTLRDAVLVKEEKQQKEEKQEEVLS